ncbi:hydrogenase 4 subunit B [Candidatus Roizmanbacteria bacterium]|nr:hydrogenase 4 subunit B [Candidatus Roizmanbacteria bacterium]
MELLFPIAIEIFCISAVLSFILQKVKSVSHFTSSGLSLIGSAFMLVFAGYILLTHTVINVVLPTSFPLFTLSFHVDGLAAFFIFVIALIALPATLYGISYLKPYYTQYNTGVFGFFYNLFLLSLFLVVTSYNGLYFLFVWELMSLSSFFLVIFEQNHPSTIKAGFIYFVMTHVATGCISFAFILLYLATGSFDFSVIKSHAELIPMTIKSIAIICFIVGFGTKAGIIPFHIWLPKAHSAAPSHVSALMSGVMIKMGIFMFFRMFLDVLTPTPWLGFTILFLGALSSILGVLYALSEHDSKRLLAYHSIENIGIILLGLGGGLVFLTLNYPAFAIISIIAGLYHTINHAIFKSLLFLSAGSVISQTHTRNIEEYGGLIKKMPYTALFFLIGAIAITGLPPFNGFVSEWLTFQGLFKGIAFEGMLIKAAFIFAGVCLAFTGGLAAACFVKAFGITFLARPRSVESQHAKESSFPMVLSMGFLAALCLVFSIGAPYVIAQLRVLVQALGSFTRHTSAMVPAHEKLTDLAALNFNTMGLLLGFTISAAVVYALVYLVSHRQKTVIGSIWECGYTEITPRMEITATGFSRTLILIFKGIFRPTKQVHVEYVDADMRYAPTKTVTLGISDIYENNMYYPLVKLFHRISIQVKKIQSGNINAYLLYIFLTLIGLLLVARYYL